VALPPQRSPFRPGGPARPGAPAAPEDPAAARRQSEELSDACGKLEEELEALRARYELYFLGVERREPNRWRDEVKKKVNRLKEAFTRNTGLKFRLQSLHARCISYERLWLRSVREKEEGTYRRDLFKARLHARAPREASAAGTGEAAAQPGPAAAGTAPAAKGGPAAAAGEPAAVRPAEARPPAPAAAGDAQLRALYDSFVAAKRSCNEDVSRLTYEAVAKSVAKQVPELMARYKAKSVDFRVEVKDGKAVLKAIPKV
jgi:hypothetical protein